MVSEDDKRKLRLFLEAREHRDTLKAQLDAAELEYRAQEADVYDALDEGVEGTLKVPLGEPWGTVSFRTRETYYGRIIDEEAALDYFEKRAMLDEVSAPKIVKRRINEIVRDAREQNKDMPPGIDYYAQRGVTITRSK